MPKWREDYTGAYPGDRDLKDILEFCLPYPYTPAIYPLVPLHQSPM
jgi:hypothetical protein